MKCIVKAILDSTSKNSVEINSPKRDEVINLFNKLDGRSFTDLTLGIEEGEYFMSVGGGGPTGYVCSIQENDDIFILTNGDFDDGEMIEIIAGQKSPHPKYMVVDYETAFKALCYYIDNYSYCNDLTWEQV